jgi:hypothetical protein
MPSRPIKNITRGSQKKKANVPFSKVTPANSPSQENIDNELGHIGSVGMPSAKREPVKMN